MINREDVANDRVSYYSVVSLMAQNNSRAQAQGVILSWRYAAGLYWALAYENKTLLFKKPYKKDMLIRILVYMHIDYWGFLNLSKAQRLERREININLPMD